MRIEELAVEIISKLEARYPRWSGFDDASFKTDEIDYKRAASQKAQDLLGHAAFEDLLRRAEYDEIVRRLLKVGDATNLLFKGVPKSADLAVLFDTTLDKRALCQAIQAALHGSGSSLARVQSLVDFFSSHGLRTKWTFATYFLFLLHPDEDIFVKPTRFRWLLDALGEEPLIAEGPGALTYGRIQEISKALLRELSARGARDMIDVQSAIWVASGPEEAPAAVCYWKIAPGEQAKYWSEWQADGFASIGWNDLGDLSGLSKQEYRQRRDELIARKKNYTKAGLKQVWDFYRISVGDRIVANRGKTGVIAIGTVTGAPYYVPDGFHAHRIPVRWDDLTPRVVSEGSWGRSLRKLDASKFASIQSATGAERPSGAESASKGVPTAVPQFTARTFEVLRALKESPTQDVYFQYKQELHALVSEPMQALFKRIARDLPADAQERLETEEKLFGIFLKNDFGRRGVWSHYWGAFYPKGGKRIEDSQLFARVDADVFRCGFSIGAYGSAQRERFIRNCQRYRSQLVDRLAPQLDRPDFFFGASDFKTQTHTLRFRDWFVRLDREGVDVNRILSTQEVVGCTFAELSDLVASVFRDLYPLTVLATDDEPLQAIEAYLSTAVPVPRPPAPRYTIDDLAARTGFPIETIEAWRLAIERKGQAILYGPPGTGKTFVAEQLARLLVSEGDGFFEIVQFHPSYGYEDFMQGIRPSPRDGGLDYPVVPGQFMEFCRAAAARTDRCILIVDEINRANLSRVFGELMYLLEYRDQSVRLAAGGQFAIPRNVRIIGTMNTADRSIALVDHALRRRFTFLPMRPEYEVLRRYHSGQSRDVSSLIALLQRVNQLIGDPQYEIGISYFMVENLPAEMESVWRYEIEPYLEEYFADEPSKVSGIRWQKVSNEITWGA